MSRWLYPYRRRGPLNLRALYIPQAISRTEIHGKHQQLGIKVEAVSNAREVAHKKLTKPAWGNALLRLQQLFSLRDKVTLPKKNDDGSVATLKVSNEQR